MSSQSAAVKEILKENYAELVERFDPAGVLPHCLAMDLITETDAELIRNQVTRKDRVVKFVETAKRKITKVEDLITVFKLENYNDLADNFGTYMQERALIYVVLLPGVSFVSAKSLSIQPAKFADFRSCYPLLTLRDNLKSYFMQHFAKVRPLPQHHLFLDIKDIWVNLQLKDYTTQLPPTETEDYQGLLTHYLQPHGLPVVITGEAGVGKTTLVKKLCYDWADGKLFQEFHLILPARLREVPADEQSIIGMSLHWIKEKIQYLELESIKASSSDAALQQMNVLVILDGLDESNSSCQQLQNVLQADRGIQLPYQLLVTTRPYKVMRSPMDCTLISVTGFTKLQKERYIDIFCCKSPSKADELKQGLQQNPVLEEIAANPSLLTFLCIAENAVQCKRATDVYINICEWMIRAKQPALLFKDWKRDPSVLELGKLALYGLTQEDSDILQFPEDFIEKNYFIRDAWIRVGFLSRAGYNSDDQGKFIATLTFYHKTMQEFFAALYIINLLENESKSSNALKKLSSFITSRYEWRRHLEQVAVFLLGLDTTLSSSTSKPVKKFLTDTNLLHDGDLLYHGTCYQSDCSQSLVRFLRECHQDSAVYRELEDLLLKHAMVVDDTAEFDEFFFRKAQKLSSQFWYHDGLVMFQHSNDDKFQPIPRVQLDKLPIKQLWYRGNRLLLDEFLKTLCNKEKEIIFTDGRIDLLEPVAENMENIENMGNFVHIQRLEIRWYSCREISMPFLAVVIGKLKINSVIIRGNGRSIAGDLRDFLDSLSNITGILQFIYCTLSQSDIQLLNETLKSQQQQTLRINNLAVSWCRLNASMATSLVESIKNNKTITTLGLNGNVQIPKEGFREFCQELEQCIHLERLGLGHINLHGKEAVDLLSKALKKLTNLKWLMLYGNRISREQECQLKHSTQAKKLIL